MSPGYRHVAPLERKASVKDGAVGNRSSTGVWGMAQLETGPTGVGDLRIVIQFGIALRVYAAGSSGAEGCRAVGNGVYRGMGDNPVRLGTAQLETGSTGYRSGVGAVGNTGYGGCRSPTGVWGMGQLETGSTGVWGLENRDSDFGTSSDSGQGLGDDAHWKHAP